MGEPNEGKDTETEVVSEEKFQQIFLNMQRMIAELYEDKNTRDATSYYKCTKEK